MKEKLCFIAAICGSAIASMCGGVDTFLTVLGLLMVVDYISGLVVAVVFHNSPKSEHGRGSSAAGLKGIAKKFFMLALVGVANGLDAVLATSFIRDGVCLALVANETLSIIENGGLMGIPIPDVLMEGVDLLHGKEKGDDN